MKGYITHICDRCGRRWNVMAQDNHIEQRGYKYRLVARGKPKDKIDEFGRNRQFQCPCRVRKAPLGRPLPT